MSESDPSIDSSTEFSPDSYPGSHAGERSNADPSARSGDPFSPLVEKAIEIAAVWHDQTYRKGRWREEPFESPSEDVLHIPVMAHLTSVGMTLQRAGWDEHTVAAGFLHDMIEDANRFRQRMSFERLRDLIGPEVARRVRAVSETKTDEDGTMRSWRTRKDEYLRKLMSGSPEAIAISLADKIHNLWTMNQALAEGIDVFEGDEEHRPLSEGPSEQYWFYRSVWQVSRLCDEARLVPLRDRLERELVRFRDDHFAELDLED